MNFEKDCSLIIVDMQNDFCPDGSLAVNEGNKIKNKYPNRFIDLTKTLSKAHLSNDELIFKDKVHYEKRGHLLISKQISPFLKELIKNR